jgi:hypothetical protein
MVTIAESLAGTRQARSQLEAVRSRVRGEEEKISSAEARFRTVLPFGATLKEQFSLSEQFGVGGVAESLRRSRKFKVSGLKKVGAARAEIEEVKQRISSFEKPLQKQERLLADIQKAQSLVATGAAPFFESRRVKEFFEIFRARRKLPARLRAQLKGRIEGIKAVTGLEPVFVEGELAGFEGGPPGREQSFALEQLPLVQPSAIPALEKEGLITVERTTITEQPVFERLGVDVSQVSLKEEPDRRKLFGVIPVQQQENKLKPFVERFAEIATTPGPLDRFSLESQLGLDRPIREFKTGIIKGIIPKTPEEILISGATAGVGFGIGAGLRFAGLGLEFLGPTATKIGRLGVSTGGIALGSLFAAQRIEEFEAAPTPEAKGEVFGLTAKELGLIGIGTIAGSKAATRGIEFGRTTFGKRFVPLETITVEEPFARAPKGTTAKQLIEQFREQRIVTKGGIDKTIEFPGDVDPFAVFERKGLSLKQLAGEDISAFGGEIRGVNVFTGSQSGPRGREFAALLGSSREPGPFFSIQIRSRTRTNWWSNSFSY